MKRRIRRLGLSLCGLLLGLLAGELAARWRLGEDLFGLNLERTRIALLESRGRVASALPMPGDATDVNYEVGRKLIAHPYVGFDSPFSNVQLSGELKAYSSRDPERLRVVLLGGSVAGVFGHLGSRRLIERLQASPALEGRGVDLLRYGRGSFKQPQHLIRLVELLSFGVQPDLVINLDGFNEVALGANNVASGVYPGFPPYTMWLPLVHSARNSGEVLDAYADVRRVGSDLTDAIDHWLEGKLSWSALYALLAKRRIAALEDRQSRARARYFALLEEAELEPSLLGPTFKGSREEAAELSVGIWVEASLQLSRLCEANDIEYVHLLQPTLHDEGAKPISALEAEKCALPSHWAVGVHHGYPLLRAGGRELAARGVNFVDASRIFAEVEEPLYYDACHFGQAGNDMLADRIADAIIDVLEAD